MCDAEEIVRQLREAFADTEQPSRESLFNNHCCECAEVSSAYAGKRWSDVTLEDVLRGLETALLTASAWRYYLPALLIWTIRAPDAVDVLRDNLVYQLEPPRDGQGVPEWFDARARGFSVQQRLAIVAFLNWYREREEAAWAQFGSEAPRHVYNALGHWAAGTADGAHNTDSSGETQ